MAETTAQKQARLAALQTRREQILTQQNPRATEIDGQRTEFFEPNLQQLDAEIRKLEQELSEPCTTTRRGCLGVYF